MSDLINRQDAIEYFMTNTNWHDEDGYTIEDAEEKRKLITDYFNGVPSAERQRGEWALNDDQVYECKDCGYVPSFDGYTYFNYCPNCGSEMRERRGER